MTDTKLGELIKARLLERDMSINQAALYSGVSAATISRIISGDRNASAKTLEKLSPVLGVPFTELMVASGLITKGLANAAEALNEVPGKIAKAGMSMSAAMTALTGAVQTASRNMALDFRVLPIIGVIRAGYNAMATEDIEGHMAVPMELADKADYLLRVQGDSMTGAGILSGDLVLVKHAREAEAGQIVVAVVNGDEATLKFLVQDEAGRYLLRAANKDYGDVVCEEGYTQIIGTYQGRFTTAQIVAPEPTPSAGDDKWLALGKEAERMGYTAEQIAALLQMIKPQGGGQ